LLRLCRPELLIARSVFAASLAQMVHACRVVYDGRGAIAAEWKEYSVIKDKAILDGAESMERNSVLMSTFRIAVSQHLVDYWKREYQYNSNRHVVIPCTVNQVFESARVDEVSVASARNVLGFSESDVVLVYSGSVAGWQSMALLHDFLRKQLLSSARCKVLFLSSDSTGKDELAEEFPARVLRRACSPEEIPAMLLAGDYGLLIREHSVTNEVASPVKFAEYLCCGLPVIISEGLGDYSEFVRTFGCGHSAENLNPVKVEMEEKKRIREIGLTHFTKSAFAAQYQLLVNL
jgi:hypothetical protein